ncbi:MAG: hypothetical protein ACD_76C00154G0005 [uncultured bacterium]|nr:MAG: hypothetical protein ACD_76C00154G0005 [uncultured bacterium]HBD05479.1 hypothetical protein [Candidatus Uhrbacteria bacterium]
MNWRSKNKNGLNGALMQALEFTFKHPHAWVLGVFAGFAGISGVFELLMRAGRPQEFAVAGLKGAIFENMRGYDWLSEFIFNLQFVEEWRATIVVIISLVIFTVVAALIVLSQTSLLMLIGRKTNALGILELFGRAKPFFLRALFVNAARLVLVFISMALVSLLTLALASANETIASLILVAALALSLMLVLFIATLSVFALIEIAVLEKSFYSAVCSAWRTLIKHKLASAEIAIMLFAITLFAGIVTLIAMVVSTAPLMIAIMFSAYFGASALSTTLSIAGALIGAAVLVLGNAIVTVFNFSAWFFAYERMREKGLNSLFHKYVKQ